jgi:hypothetical protein
LRNVTIRNQTSGLDLLREKQHNIHITVNQHIDRYGSREARDDGVYMYMMYASGAQFINVAELLNMHT